jgi:hypothetical protein
LMKMMTLGVLCLSVRKVSHCRLRQKWNEHSANA